MISSRTGPGEAVWRGERHRAVVEEPVAVRAAVREGASHRTHGRCGTGLEPGARVHGEDAGDAAHDSGHRPVRVRVFLDHAIERKVRLDALSRAFAER